MATFIPVSRGTFVFQLSPTFNISVLPPPFCISMVGPSLKTIHQKQRCPVKYGPCGEINRGPHQPGGRSGGAASVVGRRDADSLFLFCHFMTQMIMLLAIQAGCKQLLP
ncbi:hypothetical protein AVEN_186833-1 [Araneus ventricosus]|uniref:Uncharacterized protein n=1 Tax=Araneus ventricosus TaxID=182803 RepID=A0A4Y2RNI4_ARAVE|nr:hypothetical protein AVEN_25157-1 [Araneus ventricosus]GBN78776.1 hypothetical protein AVEN_186833-1 [Araneus ventricosus]